MSDFRYNEKARQLDDALDADAAEYVAEKAAMKAKPEAESGIQRIAKGGTPLDEVRALIESGKQKAAQDLREHAVKQKLAALKAQPYVDVDEFINLAQKIG
jgi:hypothetical protein